MLPATKATGACRAKIVFDRETAYRLGISPSSIDQTLYDAYGQRQVSTIFTQLNQYHVVLEVPPEFQQNPFDLRHLYIRTGMGTATGSTGLVAGGTGQRRSCSGLRARCQRPAPVSPRAPQADPMRSLQTAVFGGGATASTSKFPNGGQVPLATFSHVEQTSAPITVNHQGQFPVVTLSFNLAPNSSLGEAIKPSIV